MAISNMRFPSICRDHLLLCVEIFYVEKMFEPLVGFIATVIGHKCLVNVSRLIYPRKTQTKSYLYFQL